MGQMGSMLPTAITEPIKTHITITIIVLITVVTVVIVTVVVCVTVVAPALAEPPKLECPLYVPEKDRKFCCLPTCRHVHLLCDGNTHHHSDCGKCEVTKLSAHDGRWLMDRMNEFRRKVGRGEENFGPGKGEPFPKYIDSTNGLPNLTYDADLARIAQKRANTCTLNYPGCANIPPRIRVGLARTVIEKSNKYGTLGDVFERFVAEKRLLERPIIKSYRLINKKWHSYEHLTAMIWEKSTKIGCGGLKCKIGETFAFTVVCAYAPRGNQVGKPIYRTRG